MNRYLLLSALLVSTLAFADHSEDAKHHHADGEHAAHDHDHGHDGDKAKPGPSKVVDGAAHYGETMPAGKPVAITEAIANFKAGGTPIQVRGEITKVCQKEGCWAILAEGDQYARVMTKHNFFFPTETRGKAVVYGTLEKKDMSLDQTKHMAEDAGKDPATVTEAASEYRIVATSVVIEA
jgi:hypothetical protein